MKYDAKSRLTLDVISGYFLTWAGEKTLSVSKLLEMYFETEEER